VEIKGKCVVPGLAKAQAVVSTTPISFLGDVDPKTGVIVAEGHPLNGTSIVGKVFVFPCGKGSTVGSYVIYQLLKNKKAPAAIVNKDAEAIVAVGAIISGIPMVQGIDIGKIPNGAQVEVDAKKGIVKVG